MNTQNKNNVIEPCVLCEIGGNMSSYHRLRHNENPKGVDAFHERLMLEPLEDFNHPPFYCDDDEIELDFLDDIDMTEDEDDDDDSSPFDIINNIHAINTINGCSYDFDMNQYFKK